MVVTIAAAQSPLEEKKDCCAECGKGFKKEDKIFVVDFVDSSELRFFHNGPTICLFMYRMTKGYTDPQSFDRREASFWTSPF